MFEAQPWVSINNTLHHPITRYGLSFLLGHVTNSEGYTNFDFNIYYTKEEIEPLSLQIDESNIYTTKEQESMEESVCRNTRVEGSILYSNSDYVKVQLRTNIVKLYVCRLKHFLEFWLT